MKEKFLFLVRHAESEHNVKELCSGQNNVGLSSRGLRQAKSLGQELIKYDAKKIISSDLLRAQLTAQELQRCLSIPIIVNESLRERHYGVLEGKSASEYDQLRKVSGQTRLVFKPEGGESYEDVKRRLNSVVFFLKEQIKEMSVVVVGHEGVNRMLLSILLVESPAHFPQSNACLNILQSVDGVTFEAICLNSTAHLD